jgi:SAM-dependent methyltransferase
MELVKHNWYEKWFNTPYYHLLYNNRTHTEADLFITKLMQHLKLKAESRVWDLACGKGRHSIALNKLGYNVVGTDLSEESIYEASKFENKDLQFYRLDMRSPFRTNYFDAVLNLFTSFGYFDNVNDDIKVFKSVSIALKPNSIFVFDYLNRDWVIENLQTHNEIVKDNVKFIINKEIQSNRVIKHIQVLDAGVTSNYSECVKLYALDEIIKIAEKANLQLESTFGDYELGNYNQQSPRMILTFRKK